MGKQTEKHREKRAKRELTTGKDGSKMAKWPSGNTGENASEEVQRCRKILLVVLTDRDTQSRHDSLIFKLVIISYKFSIHRYWIMSIRFPQSFIFQIHIQLKNVS